MNVKNPCVRFLKPYLRYEPGQISKQLGYGVCDVLVKRGVAEWHEAKPRKPKRERVRSVHSE